MVRKSKIAISFFLGIIILGGVFYFGSQYVLKKDKYEGGRRQIILISIDALRADHLSCYGYHRNTSPHLDALTKDSVVYLSAYANGCWTIPSHMSLLTGTLPCRNGVNGDYLAYLTKRGPALYDSIKTIAEILDKNGFVTIKINKLPDEIGFSRGFEHKYNMFPFKTKSELHHVMNELNRNKNKDFFLFIHTWMVHAPYGNTFYLNQEKKELLGQEKMAYIDNFRSHSVSEEKFRDFLMKNDLYNAVDCLDLYDGGIRWVDHCIGKIIERCKELNIYDDLMLVVLSDHGEHFGEHLSWHFYNSHGWDFFEELIRVPIILKYPNSKIRGKKKSPVSLLSIYPTIFDIFKLKVPKYIQGKSLLKKSKKRIIISEAVTTGNRVEKKMIRLGNFKYIIEMENARQTGRINWKSLVNRLLFDLRVDPRENRNLYNKNLKFKKLAFRLGQTLKSTIEDSLSIGDKIRKYTRFKDETIEMFKTLGYID